MKKFIHKFDIKTFDALLTLIEYKMLSKASILMKPANS